MAPVFSASSQFRPERAHQHLDLQLIPDDALMDLWEQTQQAAWAMEGKGWDAEAALHYGAVVVWEMQRRVAQRPSRQRFGSHGENPQPEGVDGTPLPRIFAVQV